MAKAPTKSAKKSDRIVIRLESEMRAKLHAKASALGLDDAAFVRMLIYSEINEIRQEREQRRSEFGRTHAFPTYDNGLTLPYDGRNAENFPDPAQDPEPLPVEEMDIPPDPDDDDPSLDSLLGAGPSILDEMAALSTPRPQVPAQPAFAGTSLAQRTDYRPRFQSRFANRPPAYTGGAFGAGSMTRAVGVGDGTVGNVIGDGHGNVIRDNFGHFGFVGTRSR